MKVPLSEKWRPNDFDKVIGVVRIDELKQMISSPKTMSNLLFIGSPGVGKTTVAKIICDKLQPVDVLKLNGSDTTGVDTIRDKVYNFMTSMSTEVDKPKIVWIEEFDYLSHNAFAALRSMMEKFISNARFICTANYISKIPDPIKSRFSIIEFEKPTMDDVESLIRKVCAEEKITVSEQSISRIARIARGDLRTCMNMIQQLSSNGFKTISDAGIDDFNTMSKEVYELLLSGKWSTIRYDVPNKYPDYDVLLVELAQLFCDSTIPVSKKADIVEIISDGQVDMSLSFDKHICFAAISSRIMKAINK